MELTLDLLKEKLITWKGCALAKTANPVLGEGNPHAEVMFIGEAPGKKEDEMKRPFIGSAGTFLTDLLASINVSREDVYISNVVKFRPPDNRDPLPKEKAECMPWLMLEIALLHPKIIVPLGRHSLVHFFPEKTISEAHGKAFQLTNDITIFPIYHPAAALHNGGLRSVLYQDFKALSQFLHSHP